MMYTRSHGFILQRSMIAESKRQQDVTLTVFFIGSFISVFVDLLVFQILNSLGMSVFFANVISSTAAITMNYFSLTYLAHLKASLEIFVIFFLYYALSISGFSWAIAYATDQGPWLPIIYKILSLPLSFLTNRVFSRKILGKY